MLGFTRLEQMAERYGRYYQGFNSSSSQRLCEWRRTYRCFPKRPAYTEPTMQPRTLSQKQHVATTNSKVATSVTHPSRNRGQSRSRRARNTPREIARRYKARGSCVYEGSSQRGSSCPEWNYLTMKFDYCIRNECLRENRDKWWDSKVPVLMGRMESGCQRLAVCMPSYVWALVVKKPKLTHRAAGP